MSTLVYVHGTNGSGKSTLARRVLEEAGGAKSMHHMPLNKKAAWTNTHTPDVTLVGKYLTSCGGVDGILPYASVYDVLYGLSLFPSAGVFAEGLVTPGVATCQRFAGLFDRTVFILLTTPEKQCIKNVLKRRDTAGNTKPYDPSNLHVKARSARSWADNLERTGLEVHRLQYREAVRMSLALLSLDPYSGLI